MFNVKEFSFISASLALSVSLTSIDQDILGSQSHENKDPYQNGGAYWKRGAY